jgi:hypothetical protein
MRLRSAPPPALIFFPLGVRAKERKQPRWAEGEEQQNIERRPENQTTFNPIGEKYQR